MVDDVKTYQYLSNGNLSVPGLNDKNEYEDTREAMNIMGMSEDEQSGEREVEGGRGKGRRGGGREWKGEEQRRGGGREWEGEEKEGEEEGDPGGGKKEGSCVYLHMSVSANMFILPHFPNHPHPPPPTHHTPHTTHHTPHTTHSCLPCCLSSAPLWQPEVQTREQVGPGPSPRQHSRPEDLQATGVGCHRVYQGSPETEDQDREGVYTQVTEQGSGACSLERISNQPFWLHCISVVS